MRLKQDVTWGVVSLPPGKWARRANTCTGFQAGLEESILMFRPPLPQVSPARAPQPAEDGFTNMQRAWATAKLRRSGKPVTAEAIRQLLLSTAAPKPAASASSVPAVESPAPSPPLRKMEPLVDPAPASGDFASKAQELAHILESERNRREKAEAWAEEVRGRAEQAQYLEEELLKQQQILEEARHREAALQKQIDSFHDRLEEQLQQTRVRIESLSRELASRVEPAKVRELLDQAEEKHRQARRDVMQEARHREQGLIRENTELRTLLAKEQQSLVQLRIEGDEAQDALRSALETASNKIRTLEQTLREKTSGMQGQIEALQVQLSEQKMAPSQEAAKTQALQIELTELRNQLAELTGFDQQPTLESRRILVETLEAELTRLRKQQEQFSKMAKPAAPAGQSSSESGDPWAELHRQISRRIELLQGLIAESLLFLRRRQERETGAASQNEQADQQKENQQPERGL